MSSTTINPDATTGNTGALTGGATAHAVLADSDDATYVTYENGEGSSLTFGNPTIPAGAVIKSYSLVARGDASSSRISLGASLYLDGVAQAASTQIITWTSVTQWQVLTFTDAGNDPDTASVVIQGLGTDFVNLYVTKLRLDITYVEQPTVTVANLTTVTDNNRPTIEWTPTLDSAGGAQTFGQVRIYSAAQYGAGGFDPDTSDSVTNDITLDASTGIQSETALANGTYRAYVRIGQTVNGSGHLSDWAYDQFTVNVDTPGVPTLDLIANPSAGRVEVNLSDNPGTGDTDGYQLQRKVDGAWEDVRTELGDGRTDAALFYDYEAQAETQYYRARALHDFVSGTNSSSDWIEASTSLNLTQWWITPAYTPSASIGVDLRSFPGQSRAGNITILQPLGSSTAVGIHGDRGAQTGSIVIQASDDATRDAVMRVGSLAMPVYLRPPADHHEPNRWVVLQDEDVERLIGQSWSAERNVTYGWTSVARPTGDLQVPSTTTYPSPDLYPSDDLYPS